jgi:hypothetical protein
MKDAFDDLSKALASGMSRRDALRKFGVAVAGSLFFFRPGAGGAFITPTRPPDKACQQFCLWLYGKGTSAYATCVNQAKQKYGACYDFGPGSPACSGVECPSHSFCVSNSVNFTVNAHVPVGYTCVPTPH